MRPIDTFRFLANNRVAFDYQSLSRCYAPIIGQDAVALYSFLVSSFDNGQTSHQFTELLNQLQYGMPRLEKSLSILMVLNLITFYQDKDAYLIKLQPLLSQDDFLSNALYRKMLEHHIGEYAVSEMSVSIPETAKELTKKFSEVFSHHGDLEAVVEQPLKTNSSFDMDSFKKRMAREGLTLQNENEDTIALYHFADKHGLNWYQTYHLAKETAIGYTISLTRMAQKLASQKQVAEQSSRTWTAQEEVVLKEVKASSAEVFLAKIKQLRQATITADERKALLELANQGFLDEVINVMVLYTFNKTNSANLNQRYLKKIANDFAYQNVRTAEMAMEKMRQFKDREPAQKQPSKPKTNVPEWSNQDYQNQTSVDEQKRLEEIKRRALEKVRKDGE